MLVEQQLQTDRIMQKCNAMTEEFVDIKKKVNSLISEADKMGSEPPANGAQGGIHGLASSYGGLHSVTASSTSSSSHPGVAQGVIYCLASSYGGLHPGIAFSTSISSHSGVAQSGIYGLAYSYEGLHPEIASYNSSALTSEAAQGGIHGLVSSHG